MANVLVNDASLQDIADAIREKNGSETTYKPREMGAAVRAIESGGGDGINLSGFTGHYNLPTVANLSNLILPDEATLSNNINYMSNMFQNATKNSNGGYYVVLETVYLPNGIVSFSPSMFQNCAKLKNIYGDLTNIKNIATNAFNGCTALSELPYMPNLENLYANCFNGCTALTSINIYKKLTSSPNTAFNGCTNLKDIYVPWAEGEVANAPWGATNATIHYNTVYDENHEPIV